MTLLPGRLAVSLLAVSLLAVSLLAVALLAVALLRVLLLAVRLLAVSRLAVSLLAVSLLAVSLLAVSLLAVVLLARRLPVLLLAVGLLVGRLSGRLSVVLLAGLLAGRGRGGWVGALRRLLAGRRRVGERLRRRGGLVLARRRVRLLAVLVPVLVATALGHGAHRTVARVRPGDQTGQNGQVRSPPGIVVPRWHGGERAG